MTMTNDTSALPDGAAWSVRIGDGDPLTEAFSAVLDAVTTDAHPAAIDAALRRLCEATTRSSHGADLWTFTAAAYRAAGQAQARRRREMSLLALHEATAGLYQESDVESLRAAIIDTIPRLVPEADAAWLSAGDEPEDQVPNDLGAVLTAPLTVRGTVAAVLHVARHDELPFGPEDSAIVRRFAVAAAARLDVVSALCDSRRRNADLVLRLGDCDRTASMMDALLRLDSASKRPPVAAVADVLADGLDADIAVFDADGRLIAAHPAGPRLAAPAELISRAAADPGRVIAEPGTPGSPFRYAAALSTSGRSAGIVLIERRSPLTEDAMVGLHLATRLVAMLRVNQNALLEAYDELRIDLLTELLSARRPLPRPVRILAEARQFALDRRYVIVAVDGEGVSHRAVADVAGVLGGIGGRYAGTAVALLPGEDPAAAAAAVTTRLTRSTTVPPVTCASDPVDPADGNLSDAFEAVRHGLALLRAPGSVNRSATTRELALYRPLFDPDRSDDVQEFLQAALSPLLDYQRDYKIDLVETVRVFLDAGSNASQAARRLYIHPNTMTKRLERVSRLLGPGWQEGIDGLRLRLALHLRSLGTNSGPDARHRPAI